MVAGDASVGRRYPGGQVVLSVRETVAVRLYHFTDAWADILNAGSIDPAFSPWDDGTPKLVHFSTTADIKSLPESHQHLKYRVTVDVDGAEDWSQWAWSHLPPAAASVLAGANLGGTPGRWMVLSRAIPRQHWIETHVRAGSEWEKVWPA